MSRLFALLTLVAVTLGFSSPAMAETEPQNLQELVAAIEARYGEVQALEANYEQKVISVAGEFVTNGKVTLGRPRLMKWDTTQSPGGSLFVTDGEKMWVYAPADKQVLVYNDLSQAGGGVPMDLLGSIEKLDEHFDVTILPSEGDSYKVKAAPKGDAAANYKEITLEFGKSDYQLRKVSMLDQMDTVTEITLTGVTLNPTIDTASFTFVAPAGVEVVDVAGL